jgi:hypothetical protein
MSASPPSATPTDEPVERTAPPRLLDQVAETARERGASEPTIEQLASWVRAYVLFHGKRHPRELGLPAVSRFLQRVVRTENQPLPALEAARAALELLYTHVLGMDLGDMPRPQPPRLLDQMSQVLRVRHYSPRTETCYLHWAKQFILFHGKRHPRDMGGAEVAEFLTHLAVNGRVSASTQTGSQHQNLLASAAERSSSAAGAAWCDRTSQQPGMAAQVGCNGSFGSLTALFCSVALGSSDDPGFGRTPPAALVARPQLPPNRGADSHSLDGESVRPDREPRHC